jgi:hypothetical protein
MTTGNSGVTRTNASAWNPSSPRSRVCSRSDQRSAGRHPRKPREGTCAASGGSAQSCICTWRCREDALALDDVGGEAKSAFARLGRCPDSASDLYRSRRIARVGAGGPRRLRSDVRPCRRFGAGALGQRRSAFTRRLPNERPGHGHMRCAKCLAGVGSTPTRSLLKRALRSRLQVRAGFPRPTGRREARPIGCRASRRIARSSDLPRSHDRSCA